MSVVGLRHETAKSQTRHGAKLVRLERTLSEEKYGAAMRLNGVPGPSSNAQIASASRQLSRRAPLGGWGGRDRTSEWRNQNRAPQPLISTTILNFLDPFVH
jgi:hypothetical protein